MYYGSLVTNPVDATVLSALVEHWVHVGGGSRREQGRYHTPSVFFTPGTRLGILLQAVETASPPLVLTSDLCGLYYNKVVSCMAGILHVYMYMYVRICK